MPAHPDLPLNPWVTQLAAPAIPTVAAWAQAYGGQHGPMLGFSQAVPGYPPHPLLLQTLSELAADPATCQYGDIEGELALRRAYAQSVTRMYGAQLQAGQVQITAGCNQAFAVAMQVLARPGDAVALVEPYYFNHQTTLQSMGIAVQTVPAQAAHGFVPQLADIAAVLQSGVRALVLISPNNPTGAIYPPELLEQVADLCRQHGCWLVLDETYRDFLPDVESTAPHRLLLRPDWDRHTVLLYSFSKSLCIPGHRLGVLVAGARVQAEVAKVMDNLQICAPRLPQLAVARALQQPAVQDWLCGNRNEITRRADALRTAFAALAALPAFGGARHGWQVDAVGAYFAFVRHPFAEAGSVAVARALAQYCGLLALPGEFFGPHQQRYLRVAFANADVATIAQIAQRLPLLPPPAQWALPAPPQKY